jgi:serine/threonine-protein kinase
MRHVREEVPDVQRLRPGVSAAAAAVVDRAVAKDLRQRYPDAASMVTDLEHALAIEAQRSGQATGEVSSVLGTLPGSLLRRLPWRMRHPTRWAASLAVLGALLGISVYLLVRETHRGNGVPPGVSSTAGLVPVPLSGSAAHSYNPFGTEAEDEARINNLVDGDVNTTWSTEQYYSGTLKKSGGVGTGVYLDASPGVVGRAIEIQTTTPGFAAQIYASNEAPAALHYGESAPLSARGWQGPLGGSAAVARKETIRFAGARRFGYYLVWFTSLPPGMQSITLNEVTLLK